MAEIKLNVTLNTAQAKTSVGELSKYITDFVERLNKVKVNKDVSAEVKSLASDYAQLAANLKKITDEEKAQAKAALDTAKAKSEQSRARAEELKSEAALIKAKTDEFLKEAKKEESASKTLLNTAKAKTEEEKAAAKAALDNARAETMAQQTNVKELTAKTGLLKEQNRHLEKQEELAIKAANADQKAALQAESNRIRLIFTMDKETDSWRKAQLAKEKEANRHEEATNRQVTAQEKVAASINKTTEAYKKHSFTIGDTIARYAKFAVASMLVYEPLRKIMELLGGIGDTLVKTEDTIIALQRILPAGSGTNEKLADDLYALAQEYGQTFDNVQQIATNFARTGMDWTETLDATRAALLALNVAELDSAQASDGLIAVMSQFKIDAKDLTGVIDMLNKTADNFPVTTEKLLYALQRTGSAAVNANISLEDTIGIITSLSEATGRSGQNLGTAVNALIQYSSKADALEIFAKLDENSAKAVENFRMGAGSILDVWKAVSDVINNANAQQQQALNDLANMDEVQSLASDLHDELGDIFEQTQEVYGTANTFRKNYFISLLANIDTVMNASKVASDSAGYSQKENAQYLETYTAKANELKSLWEDIANDEQGILGFKKGMADLGVSILTVIKNTGGLKTALVPVSTLMTAIFSKKIVSGAVTLSENIGNLGKRFAEFRENLKNVTNIVDLHRKAQEADNAVTSARATLEAALRSEEAAGITVKEASAAVTEAETAASEAHAAAMGAEAAAAGVLNIAMAALTVVVAGAMMAYSSYVQGLKDAAEASKKAAEKLDKEIEVYRELKKSFEEGTSTSDKLKEAFYEQARALGYTRSAADRLIETYGDLEKATDALLGKSELLLLQERKDAAEDAGKTVDTFGLNAYELSRFHNIIRKNDEENGYSIPQNIIDEIAKADFDSTDVKNVTDYYNQLLKIRGMLTDIYAVDQSIADSYTWDAVRKEIARVEEAAGDYLDAQKAVEEQTKRVAKQQLEALNITIPQTTAEYKNLYKSILSLEGVSDDVKLAMIALAKEGLAGVRDEAKDFADDAEILANKEKTLEERTAQLAKKYEDLAKSVAGVDLDKASADDIFALIEEANAAGTTTEALAALIAAENDFDASTIDNSLKIKALNELADSIDEVMNEYALAKAELTGELVDVGLFGFKIRQKARELAEGGTKTKTGGGSTKSQKTPAELAREAANAKITEADSAYNLAQVDGTDFAGQVAALNAKADAQMAYVELLKAQNATQTDINNALAAYYQTKKQISDLETKEAERKDKEYKDTIKSVGDQFAAEINSLKTVYTLREKEGATLEEKNAILEQEIGVYDRDIAYYEQFVGYEDTINKLKTERLTIEEQIRKNIEADQKARIEAFDDELSALKTEYTLREHQGANERELIGNLRKQQDKLHGKAEYYREIGKSQEEINKLSNEWWEIEEKIEAVIKSVVDEHRKLFEEEFDKYQKAREDFLQAQIDSLKRTKELNSETLGIEEKRLAVMEAQKKLLDAMANRTVRVYNAETGRFEWQANEAAVTEARSGLKSARQAQADAKLDARIAAAERSKANAVSYMEGDRVREMAKFEGNARRYGDALRGTLNTGNAVAGNTTKNEDNSTNYFIGNISMKKQLEPDMTLAEAMNLMRISGKND